MNYNNVYNKKQSVEYIFVNHDSNNRNKNHNNNNNININNIK